jgi:hypothetical protein
LNHAQNNDQVIDEERAMPENPADPLEGSTPRRAL